MTTAPTESAESQGLLLQLLDPANRADPYRLYAQFRERGALQLPEANLAVFLSYRDCDEVLRHPSSSSDNVNSTVAKRQAAAGTAPVRQGPPGFLFLDPPDHTRLRRLVSKAFAPRVVAALEPDIRSLVDGLLDRAADKGELEIVEDFAYPLPVAVICRLLGVPLDDEPQFSRASALLAQALDPFSTITRQRAATGRDLAARLLPPAHRGAPVTPGRRPAVGADRRRGVRGSADRGGDRLHLQPAADRRARDDGEPDRQRRPGDVARPRSVGRAGRRPGPGPGDRGGDAALRPARAAGRANRFGRHGDWRCGGAGGRCHDAAVRRGQP